MNFPQVGQILPNGHTVDAAYCVGDARYVLAHRDGEHKQFAVWSVDQDGDTINGHYFHDPIAAQKKFNECCFSWPPEAEASEARPSGEDLDYLREAAERAVSEDFSTYRLDRQQTIHAVVHLIIERMEEKNKGNLTAKYVIGILQEAITRLEANALMSPAKDYLLKAES